MNPRWLSQTKPGGPDVSLEERGDCTRACICSILGIPIESIANCHGDGWWERLQAEVTKHGYCLAELKDDSVAPPCYWIATVQSLNLPPNEDGVRPDHTIVMRGDEFIHDPSTANQYTRESFMQLWEELDFMVEGWVLVPLDPVGEVTGICADGISELQRSKPGNGEPPGTQVPVTSSGGRGDA